MTAKEMFEALGFKIQFNNENQLSYLQMNGMAPHISVEFDKRNETFIVSASSWEYRGSSPHAIDKRMYRIITQQRKELGWLDD